MRQKTSRVYEAPKLLQAMVIRKPVVIELMHVSVGPPGTATIALYLKPGRPTVIMLSVGSAITADWDVTIAPEMSQ